MEIVSTTDYEKYFQDQTVQTLCLGRGSLPCVYALSFDGGPAKTTSSKPRCVICDRDALATLCKTARGRITVAEMLVKMTPEIRRKALEERIPERHVDAITANLTSAVADAPEAAPPRAGLRRARKRKASPGPLRRARKRKASPGPYDEEQLVRQIEAQEAAWRPTLEKRELVVREPTGTERSAYEASCRAARKRARVETRQQREEPDGPDFPRPNDTSLPVARRTKFATDVEFWCRYNSWGMCQVCRTLQPRDLTPRSLNCALPPELAAEDKCAVCESKQQPCVPRPAKVPEALRGLSDDVVQAITLVDVDVGPEIRSKDRFGRENGYRQHAKMMRFSWKERSVRDRIADFTDDGERRRALAAVNCLLSRDECDSYYYVFYREHNDFLLRRPDAKEKDRKRWLRFIEREGVECAIWPHLFYDVSMCLTHVRHHNLTRHVRRTHETVEDVLNPGRGGGRGRARGGRGGRGPRGRGVAPPRRDELEERIDDEAADADDEDFANPSRASTKKAYMALALSPSIGFGYCYELLHFAYDLSLWSSIGSKRNLKTSDMKGGKMRVLTKSLPFSPLYWQSVHLSLLDLVRQRGYPKLFFTLSPYEFTLPYHVWMLDEMEKSARTRMRSPLAETLHMTHVLRQITEGALTGANRRNKRADKGWTGHLLRFSAATSEDPAPVDEEVPPGDVVEGPGESSCADYDLSLFTRIEFQDGSRKAPTQDYHGSGRPHLHALVWTNRFRDMHLEQKISASEASRDEPALRGYVRSSQEDRDGNSGWPVYDEASCWDSEAECYRVHHSESDHRCGVRAYFPDLLEPLKCHEDLIFADGDAALRAYVAKYSAKFSDSFENDLLNDAAGAEAVASSVLSRYHPFECEKVLYQCGANLKLWYINSDGRGKRDFVVPWPDKCPLPEQIRLYEKCEWRGPEMSLLEFLRRSDKDGGIAKWLKDRHSRDGGRTSLEEFARNYPMSGEQLVAAEMLSRLNDKFHGQWLVLYVPFRRITDFLRERVDELVPEPHRYLAMAMTCEHPLAVRTWGEHRAFDLIEAAVREELRMEACGKEHTRMVLNNLRSQMELVKDYLAGRIDKNVPREVRPHGNLELPPVPRRVVHRLPIQRRYGDFVARGEKTVEARVNIGPAARVKEGDVVLLAQAQVLVKERLFFKNFRDLLSAVDFETVVPDARYRSEALDVLHSFANYERLAAEHGVLAFVLGPAPEDDLGVRRARRPDRPCSEQVLYEGRMRETLVRTRAALDAVSERESDAAREDCRENSRIQVCEGPPGSGKTTFVHLAIEEVLADGGRVLFALPTAQLASRMREIYGDAVDIDTFHAAVGFDREFAEVAYSLVPYTLVVVDEMSQLNADHFHRLWRLWQAADRVPAVTLIGDRHQMAGFGGQRVWQHSQWRRITRVTKFRTMHRCQDPDFARILTGIRTAKPLEKNTKGLDAGVSVEEICRRHKAWNTYKPEADDIRRVMLKHPGTTMLAVTRVGAALLNELNLKVRFGRRPPLVTVDGDLETNPENYEDGRLKPVEELRSLRLHVHAGMYVYLTRNVNKSVDYVNGMLCSVETWDERSKSIRVLTATGHRVAVWPWTDRDLGGRTYYPVRPGYASTILKFQGAELDHVTVWLDAKCPGAAYTALSRVRTANDYLIGGCVDRNHFTPAA